MNKRAKTTLKGRLTKDPEITTTKSGKSLAKLSIATNEYKGKEKGEIPHFFNVTAWEGTADYIGKLKAGKGDLIEAVCSTTNDKYDKKCDCGKVHTISTNSLTLSEIDILQRKYTGKEKGVVDTDLTPEDVPF